MLPHTQTRAWSLLSPPPSAQAEGQRSRSTEQDPERPATAAGLWSYTAEPAPRSLSVAATLRAAGNRDGRSPACGSCWVCWEPPAYCCLCGPFLDEGAPAAVRPRGGRPSHGQQAQPSVNKLHVVGGKHAEVAVGPVAAPPAFIDHLDARDEVLGVEGDLGLVS